MKRGIVRSNTSTLISIFLLYCFIVVLMLLLSAQILEGIEWRQSELLWVILAIAALLPVALAVAATAQLIALFRERKRHIPGSGYRLRIILTFVILVIFAAVPQGILSLNFISTALSAWFRPDLGEALDSGLNLAVEYYQREAERLERFSNSDIFRNALRNSAADPGRAAVLIRQLRPELSAVQIVAADGRELAFNGNLDFRQDPITILQETSDSIVRASLLNHDLLRIKTAFGEGIRSGAVVMLSYELSPLFEERAAQLQSASRYFSQFSENSPLFSTVVFLFYALFSAPMIFASILASIYLSREMVKPILSLEAATRKIADGDYSFRVLSRRRDELDHLSESFNRMLSELERSRNKLVHSERIAAWKDMAQRLAHEIKNPLTPIKLSAERLVKKYAKGADDFGPVLEQSVATIITEVDRLAIMLTEFRNFARLPNPEPQVCELRPIAEEFRSMFQEYPNIRIDIEGIPVDSTVYADPKQFRQILSNLLKNSVEAMPEGGVVSLAAFKVSKAERVYCRILVSDNGPGIEPGVQVFTPYVTTKANGTGLGLAIVERIVSDHLGQISYESEAGAGTRFFIDFPEP